MSYVNFIDVVVSYCGLGVDKVPDSRLTKPEIVGFEIEMGLRP